MKNIKKITIIAFILILVGTVGSLLTFNLLDKPQLVSEEKIIEESNISEMEIILTNADLNLISTSESKMKVRLTGTTTTKDNLSVNVIGNKVSIKLNHDEGKKLFNLGLFESNLQVMVYIPEKQYEAIKMDLDNGNVQASQIKVNELVASTVNGNVEIGDIASDEVNIHSTNGKLILWNIEGELTGDSENGMISLKADNLDHAMRLESKNGTIEIQTINEPTNVTFDVDTANGKIDILGDDSNNIIFGNGEQLIQLRTYNGSIVVSKVSKTNAEELNITTVDGRTLDSSTLTDEILKIMDNEKIPGASIAIINNNEVVYHEALGVANMNTKEPVDRQSIFEGASLSKPIFAYFALKMVEEGTLDLDQPLYEYLPHPGIDPESQEDYKLITARMVLSHQTGFPNHAYDEMIKLAFKPGTDFMYSGEAYQYLAAVIGMEKGVGWKAELNTLFQETVTKPLQMERTTFVWDDYLGAHKVFGHDENGEPTQNKPGPGRWSGETFNAFSSVHSEASEYAQFVIAILKREGLSQTTFDEMLKEQIKFSDDNPLKQETGQTGWGLGFTQKITPDYTMHFHTGNNHDFQAYAMFIPEKQYGIVAFINSAQMETFLESLSEIIGLQF